MKILDLKALLDRYANIKNTKKGLLDHADPLQVAAKFRDPYIALICALFSYGNANQIVKFLNSLDFNLLDMSEKEIAKNLKNFKYRFQSPEDVRQIFITIARLKKDSDIEAILRGGYAKNAHIEQGIGALIDKIYKLNNYRSNGYEFFYSKAFQNAPTSPLKRYNMYLRWMVRDSDIDLGLFKSLPKSALLIPLDTHTHRVSLALGLITRKSYDFSAVCALTEKLREFDINDPIKYDFALYRIGQSGELARLLG